MADPKNIILDAWDFSEVPSPSYVLRRDLLDMNLALIDRVRRESGAEIIVALKANAMWSIFGLLSQHSDGATASSLAEARLVFEEYGSKAHTFAPVYTASEIDQILSYSSHITFNSVAQAQRWGTRARAAGVSCGLRVNPEWSPVETALYNPCDKTSRLGVRREDLQSLPEGIEGLHFHALCESRPADLRRVLEQIERLFGEFLPQLRWLNMGGGHLMTHVDYDEQELIELLREFGARHPNLRLILEPGSAFTWDTGCLVATVEDKVHSGGANTLMLNVSFACHMPDCLEMPYKPVVLHAHEPREGERRWRIGGNSCLAGDVVGDWAFDREPQVGDKIAFRDMIHYTMVKTTMFNGVTHPSIGIVERDGVYREVRRFGYEDYKNRMS